MFSVVENSIRTIWCALDGASTYYQGQLVKCNSNGGSYIDGTISPLPTPTGKANTDYEVIFGVLLGFNDEKPVYGVDNPDTTFALQTETGITTQAAQIARITTGFFGAEGMYSKSDPQPLAQVAVIGANTVLKGDIFNGAHGTACAIVTDTGGADTTGYTAAGTTTAAPANLADMLWTYYCRTGANAGLYRTNVNTTNTAPDVNVAFPYDVALGDTFVPVPLKQGFSLPFIEGPGLYFDQGTIADTNSFEIIVYELNLQVSGREHAIFSFTPANFEQARGT